MKTITREHVGTAVITLTHDTVAGADIWRVETLSSGVYQHEFSRSHGTEVDATDFLAMVRAYYNPTPDPSILLPPIPDIERPEPRDPVRAALAHARSAHMTTRDIATALKVTPQTVNRWTRGGNPTPRHTAALLALSDVLWARVQGCGCQGVGVIATGDTRNPDGRIVTAVQRCSVCNPKEK
jgi:hypothetical protein